MNDRPVSDFAYVGGRPYIRGVDLAGFYLDHVDAAPGTPQYPALVRSLKLTSELAKNGVWLAADDSAIAPGGPEPSAVLDVVDGAGTARRMHFLETGETIERSAPDVPKLTRDLAPAGDFAGNAALVGPVDFMVLLGGLVEANKALHAATLTARGLDPGSIRFVYVERLPVLPEAMPGPVEVAVTHRGARVMDGRAYTLNIAEIGLPDGPVRAMICFSYDPEEDRA